METCYTQRRACVSMAYFLKYFMSCLYLLDVVLLFITFLSSNLKMLAFRNTQYYVAVCYFIIKFKSSNKLYGKEAYMWFPE
jgi:hypothetical protein